MKVVIHKWIGALFDGIIGRTLLRRCPEPITNVQTYAPVAALTFDDGPHPAYTPGLLRILDKYRVRGTFFMVGEAAERYPELVERVARAGHVIGNHSYSHHNLSSTRSHLWRLKQLRACQRAMRPYGRKLFRPPFGRYDEGVKLDAWLSGFRVVLWNGSAQDWLPQNPDEISRKIVHALKPGGIVLLHDAIYSSNHAEPALDRGAMLEGLEMALALSKKRFSLVTVPDLLGYGRPVCHWSH